MRNIFGEKFLITNQDDVRECHKLQFLRLSLQLAGNLSTKSQKHKISKDLHMTMHEIFFIKY